MVDSPLAVRRPRDVVVVAGPDSGAYLQGQLSQDVEALPVGGSGETFVLQPTGKVDAWMRVTRLSAERYVLDVDIGYGKVVAQRLTRFLLRTDCTVEAVDWDLVTVLDGSLDDLPVPKDGLRIAVSWPGLCAVDLLGPSVSEPEGLAVGGSNDWEVRRISAGIPAMGSEMDGSTIPAATGVVNRSASFTKGCYTGQELVARVDSRAAGAPTRILRATGAGTPPPVGTELEAEGRPAGRLTSVAAVEDGFVALAEIRRAVATPVDVQAVDPTGSTTVSLLDD